MRRGYQPNKGKLNTSNPPRGGSGVERKHHSFKGELEAYDVDATYFGKDKLVEVTIKVSLLTDANIVKCLGVKGGLLPLPVKVTIENRKKR